MKPTMDPPLNALTLRMRRTLVVAASHARAAGHRHIGTEHVLLALADDGDGIAGQVLTAAGVREEVRSNLRAVLAEMPAAADGKEVGHPDDAVRVVFDVGSASNHPIRDLSALEEPMRA